MQKENKRLNALAFADKSFNEFKKFLVEPNKFIETIKEKN